MVEKILGVLLKSGRSSPILDVEDERMELFGEGPVLRLDWFNSVFCEHMNFVFTGDFMRGGSTEYRYLQDMTVEGCIYYDGIWYTDFEICTWPISKIELFEVEKSLYHHAHLRNLAQEHGVPEQTQSVNAQTFTIHWLPA